MNRFFYRFFQILTFILLIIPVILALPGILTFAISESLEEIEDRKMQRKSDYE